VSERPVVVVVGDLVTDVLVRLAEPPVPGSDASADIAARAGGSAANLADWLATAGADVHLVARVGDDLYGRAHATELRDAGVAPHLAVDARLPTGTIVVLIGADGERTMLTDRGASLAATPADLPDALLHPGRHLHVSGYALLDPGPRPAALRAIARARAAGMSVSVDPSSTGPLRRVGPDRFTDWTRGADLCLPNREEAVLLAGMPDAVSAGRVLARAYGEVAVTLGAEGALWCRGDEIERVPASAGSVADTTGAGDAFGAGFLHAWLGGTPPGAALAAGTRLAARAVAQVGARPPRP
jgi:sugar/nucleoside kinase (ribokinase family)